MKCIWSVFLFITGGYLSALFSAERPTFYFYNTESNFNNFAAVKMGFDIYFADHDGYFLQPFDLMGNFEKSVAKKGGVYLLSSWHFKELQRKKVPLKIALVAASKGNIMQRKVLSAKKGIDNVEMLKNTVVAAAGSEVYVHSILQKILGKEHEAVLKDIKIKDLDALLAVGFGMASRHFRRKRFRTAGVDESGALSGIA